MLHEAIRAYESYLKKVPEDGQAMFSLANLFHKQGNYFAAKNILDVILSKHFSHKAVLLMMSTLYHLKEIETLHELAALTKENLGERPVHDQLYHAVILWTDGVPKEIYANKRIIWSKPTIPPVDVCIILEGTYPYVSGGVAQWTHDLIQQQQHLTFHLVCILPPYAHINWFMNSLKM